MKLIKKLATAAAVSFAMVGAAHADSILNNWVFNPNGTGFAGGQVINEQLDINGSAFIQLTAQNATNFTFTENATFNSVQADGNGSLFPLTFGKTITATFSGYGTGTFGGSFTFTGGTLSIYSSANGVYSTTAGTYGADTGTLIATFDVLMGGGGLVTATGSPLGNGQITVNAVANAPGGLTPGYFFNGNGTDLSQSNVLSFAFTNANTTGSPTANQVSEIICDYSGYQGAGCGTTGGTYANTATDFFVSNNGQFKLGQVPEPGSLALFGIAMLGAGVVSRKRASKA
jgi:hypothetical protein